MRDKIVSYKVAKLAQEKGFDEECSALYHADGTLDCDYDNEYDNTYLRQNPVTTLSGIEAEITAPTQSLLQKWIRENHSIDIVMNPVMVEHIEKKAYFVVLHDKDNEEIGDWQAVHGQILDKSFQDVEGNFVDDEKFAKYLFEDEFAFGTYEEALERGLEKALNHIK